jgi:hypothetical protein
MQLGDTDDPEAYPHECLSFLYLSRDFKSKKLDLASLYKRAKSSFFRDFFPAIAKQQRNKD